MSLYSGFMNKSIILVMALLLLLSGAPALSAESASAEEPSPDSEVLGVRWIESIEGGAASKPLIGQDGSVFVLTDAGKVYAYAKNGRLKWKADVEPVRKLYANRQQGQIEQGKDGTIYVGSGGNLYAFATNGTRKWTYQSQEAEFNQLVIQQNGLIYIKLNVPGHIVALRTADGTVAAEWRSSWENSMIKYAGVSEDKIYIVSTNVRIDFTNNEMKRVSESYVEEIGTTGLAKSKLKLDGNAKLYRTDTDASGNLIVYMYPASGGVTEPSGFPSYSVETKPSKAYVIGQGQVKTTFELTGHAQAGLLQDKENHYFFMTRDGKVSKFNNQGSLVWSYETYNTAKNAGTIEFGSFVGLTEDGNIRVESIVDHVKEENNSAAFTLLKRSILEIDGNGKLKRTLAKERILSIVATEADRYITMDYYNLRLEDERFQVINEFAVGSEFVLATADFSQIYAVAHNGRLIALEVKTSTSSDRVVAFAFEKLETKPTAGETYEILTGATLANGTMVWNPQAATYASSNRAVAYVENGVLHAVGEGTAEITARFASFRATRTVTVTKAEAPSASDDLIYKARLDKNWSLELPKLDAALKDRYHAPTLAEDGSVYIASLKGQVAAADQDGRLKWKHNLGHEVWMSPIEGPDGKIYVASDNGTITLFDRTSGERSSLTQGSNSTVRLLGWDDSGVRYVGYTGKMITKSGKQRLSSSQLYAANADGSQRWFASISGEIKHLEPAFSADGGTMYLAAANAEEVGQPSGSNSSVMLRSLGFLYAIDTTNGQVRWKKDLVSTNYAYFKPLVRADGSIAVVNSDGTVQAFDSAGTELWKQTLKANVNEQPFLQDDKIVVYVWGLDEGLKAVNGDLSEIYVSGEIYAVNRSQEENLFVLADSKPGDSNKLVYSYDAAGYDQNGRQKWTTAIPGKELLVSGLNASRNVAALDASSGLLTSYTIQVDAERRPEAPAPRFNDLGSHWAMEAVQRLAQAGVLSGYPDGSFRPDQKVTREQFLTMMAGMLKATAGEADSEPSFADVPNNRWSSGAIRTALTLGWIEAADYGSDFGPDQQVTRGEVAVWAARALKLTQDASGIDGVKDKSSIPSQDRGYIGASVKAGIIQGYPDGTLKPKATLSRAEAAVLLERLKKE